MQAQERDSEIYTVNGVVKDASNQEPLIGVNILVKGTSIGTVTNINGKYQISVPSLTDTLVFSYIGYETKNVAIKGSRRLNVSLSSQTIVGKQVVVIGYGSIEGSNVSGSISTLKNNNLGQIPVSQPGKALVGKISGLYIQNTDAQVGSTPHIVIRGVSSISASSSPLVVVDGFPVNSLAAVDMSNVASIEVLKDAASAAIYGSRASNGVILITTKRGGAGSTMFNINYSIGLKQPYPIKPIYPSPQEWADFAKSDAKRTGLGVPGQIPAMLSLHSYTNWKNVVLQNSSIQNFGISAGGGGESVSYYIGAGYQRNGGIIISNKFNKYDFNAKLDARMNDWLKMGGVVYGSYSSQRVADIGFHDAIRTSNWLPLRMTSSTIKYAHAAGYNDVSIGDYAAERYFSNVNGVNLKLSSNNSGYVKLVGRHRNNYEYNTRANIYADISFSKHLNFKTTAGSYIINYLKKYYQTSWSNRDGVAEGHYHPSQEIQWINENTLTYKNSWGLSNLTGLGGVSIQSNHSQGVTVDGNGFLTDQIHTLNAATNITNGSSEATKSTLFSTYYRLNYSYANKYILMASIRWDASSRFGTNKRWGSFPAISAAWRISQEDFLNRSKWISNLKLRTSYGATGNNNIGNYKALAIVSPGFNAVFGVDNTVVGGFSITNIANHDLGWEKSYSLDIGLDIGLLNNRIVMSVDYYNTKTKQMLLRKEIPSVTGFTSTWSNLGKVKNWGYEFKIKSHNITTNNFDWILSANFYLNRNKLLYIGGPDKIISVPDSKRPSQFIAKVGNPIAQFYGYVVDHSRGDNGNVPRNKLVSPYWPINVGSTYVYAKDLNHDGMISPEDRTVLGNPYPNFNWSVTNALKYRSFNLSFMLTGSMGAQVYNIDSYYYHTLWKGSFVSGVKEPQLLVHKYLTDWNVQDASFVALRTVTLGYNLPHDVINKLQLKNLKIYFSAYNLLYLMSDDYTGLNPEGVNRYNNPLTFGYQRGSMPIVRSFNIGLDLKF